MKQIVYPITFSLRFLKHLLCLFPLRAIENRFFTFLFFINTTQLDSKKNCHLNPEPDGRKELKGQRVSHYNSRNKRRR